VKDTPGQVLIRRHRQNFLTILYREKSPIRGDTKAAGWFYRLQKELGGKIRMESTKGVGSSFIITFPVQSGVLTESESSNINKPKSGVRTSPLILIVDDDEVSIAFHKTILKSASLEYLIARNGLEAVEMCRVNQGI
jgi:hypothetical protein